MLWTLLLVLLAAACLAIVLLWEVRKRDLDRWLVPYMIQLFKPRGPKSGDTVHILLCIADHFEPGRGGVSASQARERVERWVADYPRLFGEFRDSDGHPPRHTFFYPMEQYIEEHLDALTALCRHGFGEVEIHLHHDGDKPEKLRERLTSYKEILADRHGLLARDKEAGEPFYAFVHGDWALDNSRPDGKHCGVNNEIEILRKTGCYADFTMPSAPDPTQTSTINSIYYAIDDPDQPKSHDRGVAAAAGIEPPNGLLLIQGPLVLDWERRKYGIFPKIENGCIQSNQPATIERLPAWLKASVQVKGRPDWYFVKLHTHGAPEWNARVLLGEPMVKFHRELDQRRQCDPRFHFHYVTAREMYNLVRAAEAGWQGTVEEARDYELVFSGVGEIRAPRRPQVPRGQ